MNVSSFLKLAARSKSNSESLLKEHRSFLSGFNILSPVLASLEKGDLLPTPALNQILTLLSTINLDKKQEGFVLGNESKKKTSKKHMIVLYVKDGPSHCYPLDEVWEIDNWGAAERLADRKLFQREDSLFAEITTLLGSKVLTSRIERSDAIARILKRGRGPVCKQGKKTTNRLGFGGKAQSSKARFSGC